MPAAFHIDAPARRIFSWGWGDMADDDLYEHVKHLAGDPRFDPGMSQVIDFRDVQDVHVTSECVRRMAELNPFRLEARRALIANRALVIGLVRMYQLSADLPATSLRLFETQQEAFAWVGLDPNAPWPDFEPDWSNVVPVRVRVGSGACAASGVRPGERPLR